MAQMALSLMLILSEYADVKAGVAHARASVPLQIKRLFTSTDGGGDGEDDDADCDDDDDDNCQGPVLLPGDLAWPAS